MSQFVRPANLTFPTIYHTFKAKDKTGNEIVAYRVQDLPEDYFEAAYDLMSKSYLPEAMIAGRAGIVEDPEALNEMREFWKTVTRQKMSLACFREGSDDLVGINLLAISYASKTFGGDFTVSLLIGML